MSHPKAERNCTVSHGDYPCSFFPPAWFSTRSNMIPQIKSIGKRRRPAHSCIECRRRKVRCDRNKPCTQCTTHKFEPCVYGDGKNISRISTASPVIAYEETRSRTGQADDPTSGGSPAHVSATAPAGPIRGTVSKTRVFGQGHWMNAMSMVILHS
jgi:hypothetical protein